VTKQIAGLAVAASVTAVTVLGVQAWNRDSVMPAQVAETPAPVPVQAQTAAAGVANDKTPLPAHIQSQITHYLVTHNQNTVGVHGMLPYARIVGYSSGDTAE
jgi:sigma-E factor negative regulatory protein RseA